MYFQIPVYSEIVHEVVERIYNRIHDRHTYFSSKGLACTRPPADIVGYHNLHKDKYWIADFTVLGTKNSLMRPYSILKTSVSEQSYSIHCSLFSFIILSDILKRLITLVKLHCQLKFSILNKKEIPNLLLKILILALILHICSAESLVLKN